MQCRTIEARYAACCGSFRAGAAPYLTLFMNVRAACSQRRRTWSTSTSCQLPATRRCAARCQPAPSKLPSAVIPSVRSLYALAGYVESGIYCTLDSVAVSANVREMCVRHGLSSFCAGKKRQGVQQRSWHAAQKRERTGAKAALEVQELLQL